MKVFYLTPGCFDKGGISRFSRYQITALRELVGVDNVFVFSLLGPDEESFEEEFEVVYSAGGTSVSQRLAYVAKLYSTAITNRPDIILSAHVNLSGVAKLLAKLVGSKSIVNIYGSEAWSERKRNASWGLKHSDYVISDCHYTACYLEDNGLRPQNSVEVIWDCVDLERFFPALPAESTLKKYGIPGRADGINILTLGRLSSETAYKGYERLLEVFSRAIERVSDLRLIYGGRGPMVEKLRQQAEALGLGNKVFFTGAIHDSDLPDVYRAAHLFSLVTNKGEGVGEGIPFTPLEAAACGIPLLVGNHDGSQEAVVDGEGGYILDPYDLEGQVSAVIRLATNPQLRSQMGDAVRKRAELEFGFPEFLKKHDELLTKWCFHKRSNLVEGRVQAAN